MDGESQGETPVPGSTGQEAGGGGDGGAPDPSSGFPRTVVGLGGAGVTGNSEVSPVGDLAGGGVRVAPRVRTTDPLIGKKVGNHQISSVLGRGGMGVVYEATDSVLSRKVAIKMLPEALADDPTAEARFLQEARAVARLNHPNVVSIYEVGQHGSGRYLVLELVDGLSMADAIRGGPMHWREATEVIAQACRGLAAAHNSGLLHRDIKPANLLRGADGVVKIADFGLAKNLQGVNATLTTTGHVVGTPCFMSPEQCQSNPLDSRSDIYSLGATYYALLTGIGPYETSETASSILFAHCFKPVPDPHEANRAVPKPVSAVVRRAMAKEPGERYPSAESFLADLEALLAGKPPVALGKSYSPPPPPHPAEVGGIGIAREAPAGRQGLSRRAVIATAAGTVAVAATAGLGIWASRRRGAPGVAEPADRSGSGSTPGAAPSAPPIWVGILHSLSGDMAESEEGPMQGTVLAINELNERGGILGREIKFEIADGMSEPARFAEMARKLVEEKKVCTIFGCWTSACRKAVKEVVEELGSLLVYPIQYEGLEESSSIIYIGPTANQQIIHALQWLFPRQGRRYVHVGSDYVFPRVASAIIREQVKHMGGEVVDEAFVPLGSFDVEPLMRAVRDGKPSVIVNTINGNTNRAFFQALRRTGVRSDEVPTVSFSLAETHVLAFGPGMMKGDFAAWSYFMSIEGASNDAFVRRFQKENGLQKRTSDPIESAYIGVHLWAQGVAKAGDDDPKAIRTAMLGQEFLAPEGRVRIDPANGHTWRASRVGQIRDDGHFEIVESSVREVPPDPFPAFRTPEEWGELLKALKAEWNGNWEAPVTPTGR